MAKEEIDAQLRKHWDEVNKQEAARMLAKNEAARKAAEAAAEQAEREAARRMRELGG